MKHSQQKQSYSVPEVSERLGISAKKVIDWIECGEMRGINLATAKKGDRPRWRILAEDLDRFIESRAAIPSNQPPPRTTRRRQPDRSVQFFR